MASSDHLDLCDRMQRLERLVYILLGVQAPLLLEAANGLGVV